VAANAYATRALTDPDQSLPLGVPMAWVASWTWMPSLLLPMLVLPPLYPTGRPPSRYWRWHVRVSLLAIALLMLAFAIAPGGVDDTVEGTKLPWTAPEVLVLVLGLVVAALLAVTAASSILGTLVRVARARSPERQQLLWLISMVAGLLATTFNGPEIVFVLSFTLIPVAVAIGVLRYGLLGIEVVLRRAYLYVPLTVLVALVVGGLTTVLARLAPEGPLPLLAASGVVAVLVVPVAARLRRVVDRFVLGDRADPLTLVDRVGAGLEIEHDDPVASMLEAVASASGASYAAVRGPDGRLVAQLGHPAGQPVELALRHGGVDLGTLVVGPRPGEPRLGDRDRRLVAALAPHLAVVVRSHGLTDDLARERTRVTTATLAERDRLRRDLHDGLGPSPSGWRPPPPRIGPTPARSRHCSNAPARRRSRRSGRSAGCSTASGPAPWTCTAWRERSGRRRRRSGWAAPVARGSPWRPTRCRCCRPGSRRRPSASSPNR
jgi:signal transduction histidine kinase